MNSLKGKASSWHYPIKGLSKAKSGGQMVIERVCAFLRATPRLTIGEHGWESNRAAAA
jgi:hypothetical protein